MEHYPLTEEQIEFYRENGYVKLPGVLTAEELEDLRRATEEVLQITYDDIRIETSSNNTEYRKIFVQKVNLWRVHEGIRRHVLNPKIAEIARRLVGVKRIRIWHDHLLTKMPGDSRETAWHQDRPYWPMNEFGQLSCWMAVQDVNEENGCMGFVPGSHKFGRLEPINLVNPQDLFALVPSIDPEKHKPVPVPLKAGSCTFHDSLTFHYAGPNRTNEPRRAMVTIYMPDGTTYSGKGHVVTKDLGIPVGHPLDGELFPVLAEGEEG